MSASSPSRRLVLYGLLGSVLVALGSFGVGRLSTSSHSLFSRSVLLVPFRVPAVGVVSCIALLVLGALILIGAWVRLGRLIAATPASPGRGAATLNPTLVRAVWWWSVPLIVSLPVFSQDVYSYAAQGRLLAQGGNPYEDWVSQMPGWFGEGSDVLWAQSASPYGPLFLLVARGVWAVSGGIPEVSVLLFRGLALLGTWLVLVSLPRLCRRTGASPNWAVWVVLANPLWLFSMVASAHNDSLMIGLILLSFVAANDRRSVLALLLAAAAIAIKPIVVLALPFIGLAIAGRKAGWGRRIGTWAATAAVVGLVLAAFGAITGLWFGWIGAMLDQGGAAFPGAPWGLLGLGLGHLASFFGGNLAGVQSFVYLLGKLLAIGVTVWLALFRPRGPLLAHTALSLGLAVFLAPTIQPWYLLWVLPLLVAYKPLYGGWERVCILVCSFAALSGLVSSIEVPDWYPAWLILGIASVLAALGALVLLFGDGSTRGILAGFSWRQLRGLAPQSILAEPALSWRLVPRRRSPARAATTSSSTSSKIYPEASEKSTS